MHLKSSLVTGIMIFYFLTLDNKIIAFTSIPSNFNFIEEL